MVNMLTFIHAPQATDKDATGMIDYTEFCEILQVRGDVGSLLVVHCMDWIYENEYR